MPLPSRRRAALLMRGSGSLEEADLSYVLPVTAIGYVLVALTAKLFLHEHVSPWRWGGIALIVAGVTLVSRTAAISKAKPSGGAA